MSTNYDMEDRAQEPLLTDFTLPAPSTPAEWTTLIRRIKRVLPSYDTHEYGIEGSWLNDTTDDDKRGLIKFKVWPGSPLATKSGIGIDPRGTLVTTDNVYDFLKELNLKRKRKIFLHNHPYTSDSTLYTLYRINAQPSSADMRNSEDLARKAIRFGQKDKLYTKQPGEYPETTVEEAVAHSADDTLKFFRINGRMNIRDPEVWDQAHTMYGTDYLELQKDAEDPHHRMSLISEYGNLIKTIFEELGQEVPPKNSYLYDQVLLALRQANRLYGNKVSNVYVAGKMRAEELLELESTDLSDERLKDVFPNDDPSFHDNSRWHDDSPYAQLLEDALEQARIDQMLNERVKPTVAETKSEVVQW